MLKAYSIATAAASIAAGYVTDNRQSAIMTPHRCTHRQTEWQTDIEWMHYFHHLLCSLGGDKNLSHSTDQLRTMQSCTTVPLSVCIQTVREEKRNLKPGSGRRCKCGPRHSCGAVTVGSAWHSTRTAAASWHILAHRPPDLITQVNNDASHHEHNS